MRRLCLAALLCLPLVADAADSYRVSCDESTMTASDIDAGRVRCEVIVNPASPIERIVVTLALLEPVSPMVREAA